MKKSLIILTTFLSCLMMTACGGSRSASSTVNPVLSSSEESSLVSSSSSTASSSKTSSAQTSSLTSSSKESSSDASSQESSSQTSSSIASSSKESSSDASSKESSSQTSSSIASSSKESSSEESSSVEPSSTKRVVDLSSIRFESQSYTYDGKSHSLMIEGSLPDHVSVSYSDNNSLTNVGSELVTAYFSTTESDVELSVLSLQATLTISEATYDMSGITFEDKTFTYDGYSHQVVISGTLPAGVTVEYTSNKEKEAGVYDAVAHFTGDTNHGPITDMHATLTISPRQLSLGDVDFKDASFTYDGSEHSLKVDGDLPNNVEVRYENNGRVNVGSQSVTAYFESTDPNYTINDTMEATLTITKGVYDMSGITFRSQDIAVGAADVYYPSIEGTLPEGVSVTYDIPSINSYGTYEVTASFHGDEENYEPIPDMTATFNANEYVYLDLDSLFPNRTYVYDQLYHYVFIDESYLPDYVQVESYENNIVRDPGSYEVIVNVSSTDPHYVFKDSAIKATVDVVREENLDLAGDTNPVVVIANKDTIDIHIDRIGTTDLEDPISVVEMAACDYYPGDENYGRSDVTTLSSGNSIGTYTADSTQTITIDRNADGDDMVYHKFYVVQNDTILAGPYYASCIEQKDDERKTTLPTGIKGAQISNPAYYDSEIDGTGCQSVNINWALGQNIYKIGSDAYNNYPSYSYTYNGKEYRFCKSTTDTLDGLAKKASAGNTAFQLIMYTSFSTSPNSEGNYDMSSLYEDNIFLYPNVASNKEIRLVAFNTAEEDRMEYFIAYMEFLAERYSRADDLYGHITSFVIGNEYDDETDWNLMHNLLEGEMDINDYTEECMRTLRLANNAVKKFCSDMTVVSSHTRLWNATNGYGCFKNKELLALMADKSAKQGNFDWAVAWHPYSDCPFFMNEWLPYDTMHIGDVSAPVDLDRAVDISWMNIEMLDIFLHQDNMKCKGRLRQLFINEVGVYSDYSEDNDGFYQACYVAWCFYKLSCLESVVAWNYYGVFQRDINTGYGNQLSEGFNEIINKKSLDVFIAIDTEDGEEEALKYVGYGSYYKKAIYWTGHFTDYVSWLDVCGSGYDFEAYFSIDKIVNSGHSDSSATGETNP